MSHAEDGSTRRLLEEIAAMDPMYPSPLDGEPTCFYCGWLGFHTDFHAQDCLWHRIRSIVSASVHSNQNP